MLKIFLLPPAAALLFLMTFYYNQPHLNAPAVKYRNHDFSSLKQMQRGRACYIFNVCSPPTIWGCGLGKTRCVRYLKVEKKKKKTRLKNTGGVDTGLYFYSLTSSQVLTVSYNTYVFLSLTAQVQLHFNYLFLFAIYYIKSGTTGMNLWPVYNELRV